jgi:hypothetical protein
MANIKLEKLDNKFKPTGQVEEFDEEHARRILSMNKPHWKEAKTSGTKSETKTK